jgi:predicted permease
MKFPLWRRKQDEQLDDEIKSHLEMAKRDRVDRGASPDDAERAARRQLGNVTLVKETTRETWGWTSLERFTQDLRYGLRCFRRSPGFTFIAVLTLTLGIGANTAIFSVVNAVLLRPLPFPESAGLVRIWEYSPSRDYHRNAVNPWNFLDWRERNRSFEQVAAMLGGPVNLTGSGEPVSVPATRVSPEFFSILRIPAFLGRTLLPEEGVPGQDQSVVISYGLWQKRFGGERDVLNRKILVDGMPRTIVGVMPAGFSFPHDKADLWIPLPIMRTEEWRRGRYLTVLARLKPGVTLPMASEDMTRVAAQSAVDRPAYNKLWSAEVIPELEDSTIHVRLPLLVLLAAVGFVLLIACANVANLLLMRGTGRLREIAVRTALGATRGRILRQLLSECLLLTLAGCAAGIAAGYWGLQALLAALPGDLPLPRVESISLDARVFGFTLLVSILTSIVFGLLPAIPLSRVELHDALKKGSLRGGVGTNQKYRRAFVSAQVALALLLLAGAGLMIRSFARLISVDPGFHPERVLTMQVSFAGPQFEDPAKQVEYMNQLLMAVENTPGVQDAGSIHFLPMTERISGSCFARAEEPQPTPSASPSARFLIISPRYFNAMGTPMLAGRAFTQSDRIGGSSIAIVNRAFVQRFFPGENVLGKRLNVCWTIKNPVEIVGVAGDARQATLRESPQPTIFLPSAQAPMDFGTLVIRAKDDPRQIVRSVETAIHGVNPDQAITGVQTMEEVVSDSVAQSRFQLLLLTIFAVIAALLASIGVYGVVSYSVTQRTQEIAIRVALGASRSAVAGLVLREGLLMAGLGVVAGLAGALALTRVLRTLLFEMSPTDPVTLVSVSCLLLSVAVVAAILPARRAMRVDPVAALRYE